MRRERPKYEKSNEKEYSKYRLVEFLGLIDKPLISTSANISGNEVCKTIEEIENIFKDKIEGILDMPLGGEKNPSRIYDLELDEYIR